ncbi:MAG TPA: PEGA domain-containing protein [Kofleriaceae bacterium]|nr:PEGA domain-containing protein [Kofleriaceae bacterium]
MGRLSLVTVLCFASVLAHAEAPAKDPKLARKWIAAGQQLVQKGDAATRAKKLEDAQTSYDNAITAYEKAIEASEDPNVGFDLAVAFEKAGKLDRAVTQYRAFAKLAGVRAELAKKATARVDDLTMKVGLVMIITKPEAATISLAGVEVGTTPLVEPLVLMPGTHTLSLSAEGYTAKEVELRVDAGSESERTIELPAVQDTTPPPTKKAVEAPVEQPVVIAPPSPPSKLPLYLGAGATGGFVLVATVTGIMAVGKHGTFEDETVGPAARADAKDSGERLALVTDVCLVGAVVAGGVTAYWYFAKYKPAQRKLETKTAVVPWVKPDAGGLVLAGSF